MSRPDLVIFDCDGVLVDSEPLAMRVVAAACASVGWPISEQEADALFTGKTMADVVDAAKTNGTNVPDDIMDRIYADLFEALRTVETVPGIEGVLDLLDDNRIPYAVGSNGPHAKMDISLGVTGLKPRLEGRIFSARDVASPKPAPDLFLHAARTLGASADACLVIGDTTADLGGARAAGMGFIGYAERTPTAVFADAGAAFVTDMATLRQRIMALL